MSKKDEQKALEKLEREQREMEPLEMYEYHVRNTSVEYALLPKQTLLSWVPKMLIYKDIGFELNERTHIKPPKGCWYTHRAPYPCFMCKDQQLISYLFNLLQLVARKYPKLILIDG